MIVFDFMHWLGMSVVVLCSLWDWPPPLMNVRCRYSKTVWVCEVIWEVIQISITYIHFIPIRYLPLYYVSKLYKSTSCQPIEKHIRNRYASTIQVVPSLFIYKKLWRTASHPPFIVIAASLKQYTMIQSCTPYARRAEIGYPQTPASNKHFICRATPSKRSCSIVLNKQY